MVKPTTHPTLASQATPQKPSEKLKPLQHLRASDARAVAQLAIQATVGVAHMAEGVHQSVWSTLGATGGKVPGQTGGLTGLIYQSVRGITTLIGKGLDGAFTRLQPLFEAADQAAPESPQREAVVAALNGVLGDRLVASGNPLATPMTLRYSIGRDDQRARNAQNAVLDWQVLPADFKPTGKVLVFIHGLCMNDLQWQSVHAQPGSERGSEPGADHGTALATTLGYTPVYVRYNTGQHTSTNGHLLSAQLEQLAQHWPTPITDLTVVAHSMGGLVTRSALHTATHPPGQGLKWPTLMKNIVFLGTPHHGAPLERAGNWIDVILGSTPYSRPFAKLGQLRSAGITDLRYGHVLDADWQGHDRFRRKPDSRESVPLPEGVACYCVAATTASKRSLVADRLVGDGLVPLPSALGLHHDPKHNLKFAKDKQMTAFNMNHMELLTRSEVTNQIVKWLGHG